MSTPRTGHDSLLDVLSVINSSQRGLKDPHCIGVSYRYDSRTGEYVISFGNDRSIAQALEDEGFIVEKQQGEFLVKAFT